MKIAIAQLNPLVGALEENLQKIKKVIVAENKKGVELLVFPELFLVGYPPLALLEKPGFLFKVAETLKELCLFSSDFPQMGLLVGVPRLVAGQLYNSAVLLSAGKVVFTQDKTNLSVHDFFVEKRYFTPAHFSKVVDFRGEKLGLLIGADLYAEELTGTLKKQGATLLINLAAFPFYAGGEKLLYQTVEQRVLKYGLPFLVVNQVGANDQLIFAGKSFMLAQKGKLLVQLAGFAEEVAVVETTQKGCGFYVEQENVAAIYEALILGIQDYCKKTGFSQVILGLSGGIDSALVCCLAVAALGAENVKAVALPSPFSSKASERDARVLVQNLGLEWQRIALHEIYEVFLQTLHKYLKKTVGLTEENIQARLRGNILMALANEYNYLLLVCSNYSEINVGYCTLFGDLSGGLAVLADLPKTMVYQLADYINRETEIIPQEIIEKAPSAELRPGQKDQDSLPPYEVLDQMLALYLQEDYTAEELVQAGFDKETVAWLVQIIARNEYKKRQMPPGLNVISRPEKIGQKMPLAAHYW